MRLTARLMVLSTILLVVAVPATAQQIYGTLGAGGGGTSTLIELDPVTGNLIATIGDVGYRVNGMEWDETAGTLWATTSNSDSTFPSGLITIDPMTGAGTPVGSGAGQHVNVPTVNSAGDLYGWTEDTDDAVLWDTAAGTITVLGDSDIGSLEHGVAFDNSDTLYMFNQGVEVYEIDTTDGSSTFVGDVTVVHESGDAHHGDFHPVTNLYYGIDRLPEDDDQRNLLAIDVVTLAVVDTIPTVDNLHTMTFRPAAVVQPEPAIPTLGATGIALLVFLVVISAIVMMQRRFV